MAQLIASEHFTQALFFIPQSLRDSKKIVTPLYIRVMILLCYSTMVRKPAHTRMPSPKRATIP